MARKIVCIVFAVFALAGSIWLHYLLPRKAVVEISGVESKRSEGVSLSGTTSQPNALDVYLVFAKEEGVAVVFKNIDTGWGLPPYFKFNAAELQAEAQNLAGKNVLVKYYGWRFKLTGTFPNILEVTPAGPETSTGSWTRYIVFTLWGILLVFVFPRYYRLFIRPEEPEEEV